MRKFISTYFFIFFIHISFAQIIDPNYKSVSFLYDEAGNQILRKANSFEISESFNKVTSVSLSTETFPEDLFFEHIQLYPVPVQSNLTIKWDNEVNGEIFAIGLYNHSQISFFYKENTTSLNGQIDINMSSYYAGIYIIQFTLTDGRVYSKSIIKN